MKYKFVPSARLAVVKLFKVRTVLATLDNNETLASIAVFATDAPYSTPVAPIYL